jgi:DNA-binding NtrC family response regulator
MKRPLLLCVDDDPGMREFYERLFGRYGYGVIVASGGRQALELLHSGAVDIDAVISDYEMPGMNGAELAAELKRCKPTLPVIMVTGRQAVPGEAPHFVDAALAKGTPVDEILDQVEILLASQRRHRASKMSRYVPGLGRGLASVAMAVFLISKVWR